MRKTLLAGLLTLATVVPSYAWDLTSMNKTVEETNFGIGSGENIFCSGTLISTAPRLILTAYHCIDKFVTKEEKHKVDEDGDPITGPDDKPLKIKSKDLNKVPVSQLFWVHEDEDKDGRDDRAILNYEAKIVARNKGMDLAVLELPNKVAGVDINIKATEAAKLAPKDYDIMRGETVWTVGNSLGILYGSVTKGIVSNERDLSDLFTEFDTRDSPRFYVQHDSTISGGNSGGAMFNDNGELIGVNTMLVSAARLGLSVPVETVWKLLETNCLAEEVGGIETEVKCRTETVKAVGIDNR